MKYLKYETLNKKDDISGEVNEIIAQYEIAKQFIEKGYFEIYEKHNRFHDMNIMSFELKSEKNEGKYYSIVVLKIGKDKDKDAEFEVKYSDIKQISFNAKKLITILNSVSIWMYDELFVENNDICHNIMFTNETEINIKCMDIDIRTL